MTEEFKESLLSQHLREYLGDELEDGDPVPRVIQDILSERSSKTGYVNFCLKGPRQIQPYVIAIASVFNTDTGPELGMFSLAPADERQSLYFYRNLIPALTVPARVQAIDAARFHGTAAELKEHQDQTLFPHLLINRMPLAMLTFGIAIIEEPVDLTYIHHHSDVRTQQALDFLQREALKPFSGQ